MKQWNIFQVDSVGWVVICFKNGFWTGKTRIFSTATKACEWLQSK